MDESEKRLRELIRERTYSDAARTRYEADVEALKTATRDAALEEAARKCDVRAEDLDKRQWPDEDSTTVDKYAMRIAMVEDRQHLGRDIRALKSQPAERHLREPEVRRVLYDLWERVLAADADDVLDAAARLGVDLNAKPAVSGPDIYERGGFVPTKEER